MPVPSPRSKLLPARGNYSDLAANVAALLDGEICYAIDQDQYYQKEGSVLVSVGATKAQGALAESALQDAPSDGSEYVRKDGAWAVATGGGGGVAGVSSITAGTGISVDQSTGDVTITATGGGGGAASLDELSDVDLTTPATTGDVLMYDGSQFTAFAADQIPNSIGAQPRTTYVLTANGTTSYLFAGPGFLAPTPNPDLTLVRGQTYVFSNTTGLHPFEIQTWEGVAYDDGVTNNNTIGDVVFVVPMNAPSTLKYQCTAHSGMAGDIKLLDAVEAVDLSTSSVGDLSDVDLATTPAVAGDTLVYDGTKFAPAAPSGGSTPTYSENTIPQSQIIASHTFNAADAAETVNFGNWAGSEGRNGYGSKARTFWDFTGSSTESGYGVTWPAAAENDAIVIQFDFRWDGNGNGFIMGLGSDGGGDGTTGGFSIRYSTDGNLQTGSNADAQITQDVLGFVYLSDDSIADANQRYIVGTKTIPWATAFAQNYANNTANVDQGKRINDGLFYQIAFVIHVDENGDQDGRFSCYIDGELYDYNDRTSADSNGHQGPVVSGGAGFDKLYIGAPRGTTVNASWGMDNLYVAYGKSVEAGSSGIAYVHERLYGDQGGLGVFPDHPILSDRVFRTLVDTDTGIGSLSDVANAPAYGHGQSLAWNPKLNRYEPQNTAVVRATQYGGYGGYPFSSDAILFEYQHTGNMVIDADSGKVALWVGEMDYETGLGGWMQWNVDPIFPA